jgi:hypothetical protein
MIQLELMSRRTTTDRIPDPGLALRRQRRQRTLALLWTLTLGLLVAQAAAAVYSLSRRSVQPPGPAARAAAPPPPDAAPAAPDSAMVSVAVGPDSGPAADAVVIDATPPEPAVRRVRREPAARRVRRRPREPEPSPPVGVDDVTVPLKVSGSAARGRHAFRMGCGVCHGRTAKPLDPAGRTARQWSRHFASGRHGQHTPLRSYFTQAELANVKAYLVSQAGRRR